MTPTQDEIDGLVARFDLQQPDSHMGSAYMQSEPGHGDWVRYTDHATALTALRADLAAAVAERDDAMALFHAADGQMRKLKSERDAAISRAEKAEGDLALCGAELTKAWHKVDAALPADANGGE